MENAFIVGTGRCGSTLISEIVRKQGDFCSISEFFFLQGGRGAFTSSNFDGAAFWNWLNSLRDTTAEAALNSNSGFPEILEYTIDENTLKKKIHPLNSVLIPHLNIENTQILNELELSIKANPALDIYSHYSRTLDTIASLSGKRNWVERSGGSIHYPHELLRVAPTSKIVHIYRNGVDCSLSMANHSYYKLIFNELSSSQNKAHRSDSADLPLETIGDIWSRLSIISVEFLTNLPNNQVHHLNYDELIDEPALCIEKLLNFLEIETNSEQIELLSNLIVRQPSRRLQYSSSHIEALENSCKPGSDALRKLEHSED